MTELGWLALGAGGMAVIMWFIQDAADKDRMRRMREESEFSLNELAAPGSAVRQVTREPVDIIGEGVQLVDADPSWVEAEVYRVWNQERVDEFMEALFDE